MRLFSNWRMVARMMRRIDGKNRYPIDVGENPLSDRADTGI